ncbi:MAG: ATP-binding protein [Paludibacteraceae bacterium]|nr:ATP-binding protein [Paludibacteraceae bacterium]
MVITREIISKLEVWKNDADRSPLIVQGARQIGKSWAVAEFGRTSYKYTAIFNFDKQEELKSIFEKTKDVKRILSELSLYTDVPLVESETLIFFDEIQDCKAALNSLKYFKEDAPGYHVIAAGSLLGVAVNRKTKNRDLSDDSVNTFPVGKVSFLEMYPVTFREFLRMSDPLLMQQTESRLELLEPLPEILFNKLTEQYRRYQVCGGLPKPCSHMLDGVGMEKIENDLAELRKSYEYDFTKHVDAKDIPRIREIWRSIPSQLSRENKKFIFRVVREGARAREYESALDWLVLSGMVYRIYVCETPQLPLKHYEETTAFKIYMLDQAILRTMAELPPEAVIAKGDLLKEFKGAMAENFVLSSLLAQGYNSPHYWTLTGNKAEVDFLIQDGLEIRPIEVKAEENISGQSLKVYQDKYAPEIRLRFSMRNLNINGNVVNIPLFLCDWLKDILSFVKRTK